MFHHMTTNNAPVETFDVSGMSPETYVKVLTGIEQALDALEEARIASAIQSPRIYKELGDAIQYLIERYEALPNQP